MEYEITLHEFVSLMLAWFLQNEDGIKGDWLACPSQLADVKYTMRSIKINHHWQPFRCIFMHMAALLSKTTYSAFILLFIWCNSTFYKEHTNPNFLVIANVSPVFCGVSKVWNINVFFTSAVFHMTTQVSRYSEGFGCTLLWWQQQAFFHISCNSKLVTWHLQFRWLAQKICMWAECPWAIMALYSLVFGFTYKCVGCSPLKAQEWHHYFSK